MGLLDHAILVAAEAHADQFDKTGKSYILHPLAVMFAAEKAFRLKPSILVSLEEFMAAAVLHDVSEGYPERYPLSFILEEFGENVHRIVDGVTKRNGETYREFINRAKLDEGSRLLKILDINHNLGRIHLLPVAEQLIKGRYEKALILLNADDFWFLLE